MIICQTLVDDDRRHHAIALLQSLNMSIETCEGSNFTGAALDRQKQALVHSARTEAELGIAPEGSLLLGT